MKTRTEEQAAYDAARMDLARIRVTLAKKRRQHKAARLALLAAGDEMEGEARAAYDAASYAVYEASRDEAVARARVSRAWVAQKKRAWVAAEAAVEKESV